MGKTYVRCEDCRSEFRSIEWREGLTCPGCHSKNLIPVEYEDEGEEGAAESPGLSFVEKEDELSDRPRFNWRKSAPVGVVAAIAILIGAIHLLSWAKGPS